jgi:hypothetical protein
MGVTAVQAWRDDHFRRTVRRHVASPEISSHKKYGSTFRYMYDRPREADYRHVVVTRNWYDALISGYLYHKSGKECWLDWFGRPNHKGWLLKNKEEDWERRLLHPTFLDMNTTFYRSFNMTWNPGKRRDLCQYLIDEPEEMGLQVYIAWAMDMYMYPLLDFQRRRQEQEIQNGRNRTRYVCFEQFTHPDTKSDVFHDMAHWIFPDRNVTFTMWSALPHTEKRRADHASDQNPELRGRMQEMIRKLDAKVFGGAINNGNAQFGCGLKASAQLSNSN